MTMTYWIWVVVLAALLLWPVSKLIWVLSVRRMQRRLGRELSQEEIDGQRNRAWFIAVFICVVFSLIYNYQTVGPAANG